MNPALLLMGPRKEQDADKVKHLALLRLTIFLDIITTLLHQLLTILYYRTRVYSHNDLYLVPIISELVQLKLNIETSVGESTPTEAKYGTPLIEVGVSNVDKLEKLH